MKNVLEKSEADKIVVLHTPRKFPQVISGTAHHFVQHQSNNPEAAFRIDRIVAQQTGVAELERLSVERQVELLALERIKALQESAYAEAYQIGLDEGRERAYAESREEVESYLASFDNLIKSMTVLKSELVSQNEAHLMKLLMEMSSHILRSEVQMRPEIILDVIKQAVESAQTDESITVRVSSQDFAFVNSMRERFGKGLEVLTRVKFEETPAVQNGGCIVETNFGSVDASIERRVEKLWEAISEKIPKVKDVIGEG